MNGYINEVIVINQALTLLQRSQINAYLSAKWSIPMSSFSLPISRRLMTVTTSSPHNIAVGRQVLFNPTAGIFASNGGSIATKLGPFIVSSASIATGGTTLTLNMLTTVGNVHNVSTTTPIFLRVNSATFINGDDAGILTGVYTPIAPISAGVITITLPTAVTVAQTGALTVLDMTVRNNTGTVGYYIAQRGTTGSTLNITPYSDRNLGSVSDLAGFVQYGLVPFTSGSYVYSASPAQLTVTFRTYETHGMPVGDPVELNLCNRGQKSHIGPNTLPIPANPANTAGKQWSVINGAYTTVTGTSDNTIVVVTSVPSGITASGRLYAETGGNGNPFPNTAYISLDRRTDSLQSYIIANDIKRCALENTSIGTILNGTRTTIVGVSHFVHGGPTRSSNAGRIFAAGVTGTVAGSNASSYSMRVGIASEVPSLDMFCNGGVGGSNFTTYTQGGTNFCIISGVINNVATAVGDVPASAHGASVLGWRYNAEMRNTSYQGVRNAGSTTSLSVGRICLGADITFTNSSNVTDGFYDGGIGDFFVFNRILTLEERQLLEGWIAQKYRISTSLGAPTVSYNITGSSAITGSAPNYTITLTGTFTNPFVSGTRITVAGVTTNTGLNNTWIVASTSTTTVTFLSPSNVNMLWASGNGGTVTGVIVSTSPVSILHPYRLNPAITTGQNTLDLVSTISTFAQNLVAWFDAANPNLINNANITTQANGTPPTNDTAVTRWAPAGGWWANTPLQLTNSGTVTYHSTTSGKTQNGLPGINIIDSTNRLSLATATGSFSQYTTINTNNNFTWTVVFRPDSGASATTPVLSVTSGTSNRLMLCSDGTFIYSDGTTSQTLTPTTVLSNAKTHMITVYRDGTTLGYRIVSEDTNIGSNGYLAGTSTQSNLVIPTFSNPTLTFGAIGVTGFATSFTGSIFEATLFRSALSTQAIQQVEGYLAWKWGLQGSLPTTHAYKKVYT
jgi:hypothetical protein